MKLAAAAVHAFVLPTAQFDPSPWLDQLDAGERSRCQALRSPQQARTLAAAHLLKRQVLARVLGCTPGELQFLQQEGGKPVLAGAALQFNLSHSERHVALAVSWQAVCGIDIESCSVQSFSTQLLRSCMSPLERQLIGSARQPARAFYRHWTLKEAILKGLGCGLTPQLDRVCTQQWLEAAPHPARRLLSHCNAHYALGLYACMPEPHSLDQIRLYSPASLQELPTAPLLLQV